MRRLGLLLLAALPGCAGPMMAGSPGQLRPVPPVGRVEPRPDDPALCVASIPSARFFSYLSFGHNVKLRSFRLLTRENADLNLCELVLRIAHPGASIFSRDSLWAYSAFSGDLLWEGAGSGQAGEYGIEILLKHLIADFAYGSPLRRRLEEEAAGGRRLTVEALSAAGMPLLSEASMSASERRDVAQANGLAGPPAPRSLVGAPKASPVPRAPAPEPAVVSDLDRELPAPKSPVAGRHAVVIGVERYREKLPSADFAAGDATLAAEYFRRVLGVPEGNLALLVDERASKGDFEKHFERWLPNRVEKDDEVFVYFSGHGAPNPGKGDAYLVPYDGDPTYIEQTGYPLKRLYEQLAKLPARRVVVAMDSCFSGAGGRSVIAKGARPLVTVGAEALPAKIVVIAAAAGDQISNSYQEKGHGLFTYFLLKGLKEKGADLKSAYDYAKAEVSRVARREYNADQEPQWREGSR